MSAEEKSSVKMTRSGPRERRRATFSQDAARREPRPGRRLQEVEYKTRDEMQAFVTLIKGRKYGQGSNLGLVDGLDQPVSRLHVLRALRQASTRVDDEVYDPEVVEVEGNGAADWRVVRQIDGLPGRGGERALQLDLPHGDLRDILPQLEGSVVPGPSWSTTAIALSGSMGRDQLACMKFMCPICFGSVPFDQGYSCIRCPKHVICQQCTKQFVSQATNTAGNSPDSLLTLKCPGGECDHPLTPLDVMRLYGTAGMVGVRDPDGASGGARGGATTSFIDPCGCLQSISLAIAPAPGHPDLQRYLRFYQKQGGEYRECPRCRHQEHNSMAGPQRDLQRAREAAHRAMQDVVTPPHRGGTASGGGAAAAAAADRSEESRRRKIEKSQHLERLALAAEVALAESSDVMCERCWQPYCIQHDTLHVGISCRAYVTRKQLSESERRAADQSRVLSQETGAVAEARRLQAEAQAQLATLQLLERDTVPCPKCKMGVHKTMACNHMTCKCGQHFCLLCGQRIDPNNPAGHYQQETRCKGKHFSGARPNEFRDKTVQRDTMARMSAERQRLEEQAGEASESAVMQRVWTERRYGGASRGGSRGGYDGDRGTPSIESGMEARRRTAYIFASTYRALDEGRTAVAQHAISFYGASLLASLLLLPFIAAITVWIAVCWILTLLISAIYSIITCQSREVLVLADETASLCGLLHRTSGLLIDGGIGQLQSAELSADQEGVQTQRGEDPGQRDRPARAVAPPAQGAVDTLSRNPLAGYQEGVALGDQRAEDAEVVQEYIRMTRAAAAERAFPSSADALAARAGLAGQQDSGSRQCGRPTGLVWVVVRLSIPVLVLFGVPVCSLLGAFQIMFSGQLPWWRGVAMPNVLACLMWEFLPGYRTGILLDSIQSVAFVISSVLAGLPVLVLRSVGFIATATIWVLLALIGAAMTLDGDLATSAVSGRFLARSKEGSTSPLMPNAGDASFQKVPWEAAELLLLGILLPIWVVAAILEEVHVLLTGTHRPFSRQKGYMGGASWRCCKAIRRLFSCRRWRSEGRGARAIVPAAHVAQRYYASQVVPTADISVTEVTPFSAVAPRAYSGRRVEMQERTLDSAEQTSGCCCAVDATLAYIWTLFAYVVLVAPSMVTLCVALCILGTIWILLFAGMHVLVLVGIVAPVTAKIVMENDVRNPQGPFAAPAVWGQASLVQYAVIIAIPIAGPLVLISVGLIGVLQFLDSEIVLPFDPTQNPRGQFEPTVFEQLFASCLPVILRPEDVIYGREYAVTQTASVLRRAEEQERLEASGGKSGGSSRKSAADGQSPIGLSEAREAAATGAYGGPEHAEDAPREASLAAALRASLLGGADRVFAAQQRLGDLQQQLDTAKAAVLAHEMTIESMYTNNDHQLAALIGAELQRGRELSDDRLAQLREGWDHDRATAKEALNIAKADRQRLEMLVAQAVPAAQGVKRVDVWLPHAASAAIWPVLVIAGWASALLSCALVLGIGIICHVWAFVASLMLWVLSFGILLVQSDRAIDQNKVCASAMVALAVGTTYAHRIAQWVHMATGLACLWPAMGVSLGVEAWKECTLPAGASPPPAAPSQQGDPASVGRQLATTSDEGAGLLGLDLAPGWLYQLAAVLGIDSTRTGTNKRATEAALARQETRALDVTMRTAGLLLENRQAWVLAGVPAVPEFVEPTGEVSVLMGVHAALTAAAPLIVVLPAAIG